jgi:serine/threonine-protein kinase HipA
MTNLDVWLETFDRPLGYLVSGDDDAVRFRYSEDYLTTRGAHPISLSLPLSAEAFSDRATRAYFQNLLPENNQLDQIIEREHLERSDVAGILYYLGADLSGAISCLPEGSAPVKAPGQLSDDYDAIDELQLLDIVERLGNNRPLPNELRDPSPVSGYQRKVALTLLPDGSYAVPRAGTGAPTTHILKVPEVSFPREAFYEAICARLARHVGLDAAPSSSFWVGNFEVILAERFDRRVEGNAVHRVHQEDFAQALGLPPRLKYQREGSPGRVFDLESVASVLRRTAGPAIAVDSFLRSTIFNLAIGNTDNHAKNHALLYEGGASPRLAPLYDLVPITLSEVHNHRLSFSIGKAQLPDEVSAEDIAVLLAQFDLRGPATRRFVAQRLIPMIEPLAAHRDIVESDWTARFDEQLGVRSRRLLDELGKLAAAE